jgi:hypothetical protein
MADEDRVGTLIAGVKSSKSNRVITVPAGIALLAITGSEVADDQELIDSIVSQQKGATDKVNTLASVDRDAFLRAVGELPALKPNEQDIAAAKLSESVSPPKPADKTKAEKPKSETK